MAPCDVTLQFYNSMIKLAIFARKHILRYFVMRLIVFFFLATPDTDVTFRNEIGDVAFCRSQRTTTSSLLTLLLVFSFLIITFVTFDW